MPLVARPIDSIIGAALAAKRATLTVELCGCDDEEKITDDAGCCEQCGKLVLCLTHDEYVAAYEAAGWKLVACGTCNGGGVVAHYSAQDFEGAKDCPSCCNGSYWVTPKGRHVAYPGGPFC